MFCVGSVVSQRGCRCVAHGGRFICRFWRQVEVEFNKPMRCFCFLCSVIYTNNIFLISKRRLIIFEKVVYIMLHHIFYHAIDYNYAMYLEFLLITADFSPKYYKVSSFISIKFISISSSIKYQFSYGDSFGKIILL